ncbi:excinuclease ABC subunit B [Mycoplasmoides fastidiosum]|uniref:UvrABC system protein B n=1 Tax=Mycoplasmoides fastidiosum TaxID=92758 RepID=A0ABU0LYQ0_9BACT|nr:excinuclease ABC subunit B [Mycoplasmoides fastidiosum]UUD37748.1 excinuclease ABC subunit UvrB [Mycoplasmoides fastidiosum]
MNFLGFNLKSSKTPKGDQPKAIEALVKAVNAKKRSSVLLGATGTGKTFTIANVISKVQKPTLVIAHNKTLAGQLYNDLKSTFPDNRVEYYISYFDYYQPEAYIPSTDTFIEKSSVTNSIIEMMRLSTLTALTTRKDVIVVASVASIYPASPPEDFANFRFVLELNDPNLTIKKVINKLVQLNYEANDIQLTAGKFSLKGDVLKIMLGYTDQFILRVSFFGDVIEEIAEIDPLNNTIIQKHKNYLITPANEYLLEVSRRDEAIRRIEAELKKVAANFAKQNKYLEEQRIVQRTNHDLDFLKEMGFCVGIENYSAHLELREDGQTPYSLFDYFGDDWLLIIDESHITIPQIRGMFNTDKSRKTTLVQHGFRLPSALNNRPLNFEEFQSKTKQVIYVSATPNEWEIQEANNEIVEQIVRPTGLIDPVIEVRPSVGQVDDLVAELKIQIEKKHRTLVTVLTIKMAEELTEYLKQQKIKVAYLHNELKTLERDHILNSLRMGVYDVVVGINLLREGLDLPEVSLVVIFDANKPGFFRSEKSLIQIIGRAARNTEGRVIMYADTISTQMEQAIKETNRRRDIQINYNKAHNIVPTTIIKPIHSDLSSNFSGTDLDLTIKRSRDKKQTEETIKTLQEQMLEAANNQEYERAAYLRDAIIELQMAAKPKRQKNKIK